MMESFGSLQPGEGSALMARVKEADHAGLLLAGCVLYDGKAPGARVVQAIGDTVGVPVRVIASLTRFNV